MSWSRRTKTAQPAEQDAVNAFTYFWIKVFEKAVIEEEMAPGRPIRKISFKSGMSILSSLSLRRQTPPLFIRTNNTGIIEIPWEITVAQAAPFIPHLNVFKKESRAFSRVLSVPV